MSHSADYTIQGIQHMGIAVSDMDASLKLYRKLFGLDIPFFDAVAAAPLMDSHSEVSAPILTCCLLSDRKAPTHRTTTSCTP